MRQTILKNPMSICDRISNNDSTTALIRYLKVSKTQYKILDKEEERAMIDEYMARGEEDALREKLIFHNIRIVFSTAAAYCKKTRDFDNMVGKGLYGLVRAANDFDLYRPIMIDDKTRPIMVSDPENPGEMVQAKDEKTRKPLFEKVPKINKKTGKPEYIKFITYAKPWIFKMIVDEFQIKQFKIDKNSISISKDIVPGERKEGWTLKKGTTMENFVNEMLDPSLCGPKTTEDTLSSNEVSSLYDSIRNFITETNDLSSVEKGILVDSFWNDMSTADISAKYDMKQSTVLSKKKKALGRVKDFLKDEYNIENVQDLLG